MKTKATLKHDNHNLPHRFMFGSGQTSGNVCLKNETLSGFDSLLAWRRPDGTVKSFVMPSEQIKVFLREKIILVRINARIARRKVSNKYFS